MGNEQLEEKERFETEQLSKAEILERIRKAINDFEIQGYTYSNTGSVEWDYYSNRWICPLRKSKLSFEQDHIDKEGGRLVCSHCGCHYNTPKSKSEADKKIFSCKACERENKAKRVYWLLKVLDKRALKPVTIRDLWYIVTTEEWKELSELYMKKGLVNAYDTMAGGDIGTLERLVGVEREDLGIEAGQRGFLFGTPEMSAYSPLRDYLQFHQRPTVLPDLAKLRHFTDSIEKLLILEKEAFINHLAPKAENSWGEERIDYDFLKTFGMAIVTSQGYEGKYLKAFARQLKDQQDALVLSFHDADPDGTNMDQILQHHAKASAYLPSSLIIQPYRMGLFASVGKTASMPTTPMTKEHIKKITSKEGITFIANASEDTLYPEEIEIYKETGDRWEMQSLSAVSEFAGRAYVLEYMRNRGIPVKKLFSQGELVEKLLCRFSRAKIREDLDYSYQEKMNAMLMEVQTQLEEILQRFIPKSAFRELIDDIELFEEKNLDPEILFERQIEHIADNTKRNRVSALELLGKELGEIQTNTEIEFQVKRKGNKIIIEVEKAEIEADLKKKSIELEYDKRPDLYEKARAQLKIPVDTTLLFREALRMKLGDELDQEDFWDLDFDLEAFLETYEQAQEEQRNYEMEQEEEDQRGRGRRRGSGRLRRRIRGSRRNDTA